MESRPIDMTDYCNEADAVNHPPHYKAANGIEVIDVIEGFNLNFRVGAAVKYLLRHQSKGQPLQDLKKARWYIDREIAKRELATVNQFLQEKGAGVVIDGWAK